MDGTTGVCTIMQTAMTEARIDRGPAHIDDDQISLLALGSIIVRRRKIITALMLFGAAASRRTKQHQRRDYFPTAHNYTAQRKQGNLVVVYMRRPAVDTRFCHCSLHDGTNAGRPIHRAGEDRISSFDR